MAKTFKFHPQTATEIMSMGFVSSGTLPAGAASLWSGWTGMQWGKVSAGTYRAALPATREKSVLSRPNLHAALLQEGIYQKGCALQAKPGCCSFSPNTRLSKLHPVLSEKPTEEKEA